MFADISGSTKLYDEMGDIEAEKEINTCLSILSSFVQRHRGKVVKTIGDEIMCRFSDSANALQAAINIQSYIEQKTFTNQSQLQVRIGIHYGSVIEKKGDLFGDVINVAARMVSVANEKQIIVTHEVAELIPPELGIRMSQYDNVKVKGKEQEQLIYEVQWEDDDVMTKITPAAIPETGCNQLLIEFDGNRQEISFSTDGFVIGRGETSDLVIDSNFASRAHAVIEHYRGNFILKDQSRNGTYVEEQDGKLLYLKREEMRLVGSGVISLGEPVSNNNLIIRYYCQ